MSCYSYNEINAYIPSQIVVNHVFSMVMIFTRQKATYTEWNFPAEVCPNVAAIVIYSIGFAPISWVWFTLQMHLMHRKNVFMAGKTFRERLLMRLADST